MWMSTDSRKGEDNHCWMKARCCFSTPSDPPMRSSYWLFRVATTSLHISCINIVGCTVWLEKTRLHHCFHRNQRVIGLTNSNMTWRFGDNRSWVDIAMVENRISYAFITKVKPSSWCSYLSTGTYRDNQYTFPHLILPCTWDNCNRLPTPYHIRWVYGQS